MTELPEKLDLASVDIAAEKREEILSLFPEARTEGGKIDFKTLERVLGETVDPGKERYGMTWPGKAECFKTIQRSSLATLLPVPDESVNFETTENLIIEGDNLEVLKLLQKSYLGKVKMIYIDPPYNTGNDFIYPDNYSESLQTYLEYTGQVDAEGKKFSTNTEADGRFHSKWLNMMHPRLYLARNLLRDDGAIFISIDDNEAANLRKLCDEVFGSENFVSHVSVLSNPRGRQSDTFVATVHDYVLIYARDKVNCRLKGSTLTNEQRAEFSLVDEQGRSYRLLGLRQRGAASRREDRPEMYFPIYVNPQTLRVALERDDDYSVEVLPKKSTGQDGRWMWGRDKVRRDNALIQAKLIERRNEYDVFVRDYLERDGKERSRKYKSLWDDKDFNTQNGTQEVKELLQSDAMPFPKPAALLGNIVGMGADDDSLVLDFFAGSGTTAHAVMSANQQDGGCRRFILVQLPEPTGRTDYPTIADITKERVRRVAKRMNKDDGAKDQDRGYRVFRLAESNFKPWDAEAPKDGQQLTAQLELHVDHVRDGRTAQDLLFEILLKTGFSLTTPIKTEVIEGRTVFSVADGALLVCLERHLTLELIRALATMKPERVVTLDAGFAGNDPLKTNAVQIFRTAGVTSFKTV